MAKLIICIALLCVALVSASATGTDRKQGGPGREGPGRRGPGGPGGRGPGGRGPRPNWGDKDKWATELCDNGVAQNFVTQAQQFFDNLAANATFNQVVANWANTIKYIDDADTALISSNCTAYFSGLKDAKKLDKDAEKQQHSLEQSARRSFYSLVKNVLGQNGTNSESESAEN